jgi:ribosomal protein L30
MKTLRIRLVRSPIGAKPKLRRTVTALGLRRISSTVELEATPAVLGMIRAVSHLLAVEEGESSGRPAAKNQVQRQVSAQKPAAEKPAAEKPVAKKPAAKKPVAEKPAAKKPAAKKPAAQKPAAKKPAAMKPKE